MKSIFSRFAAILAFAASAALFVAPPAAVAMNYAQSAAGTAISAAGALANGGTLKIYCGTKPTDADTAISGQTLAATFTFNSPAFGSASLVSSKMQIAGSFVATTVTSDATCTATFARMFKSDGTTVVADFTVGSSGADVNFNSTSFTSGGNVTLSTFYINQPLQ